MKKENQFTVDYFINKFEAIPEDKWLTNSQGEIEAQGELPHCAIGWCKNENGLYGNSRADKNTSKYAFTAFSAEASALEELFHQHGIKSRWDVRNGWNIADVNNGDHPRYKQPTPKQRILAALQDIKAMQDKSPAPQEPPYRTVVIDSNVKSLTEKEIIYS